MEEIIDNLPKGYPELEARVKALYEKCEKHEDFGAQIEYEATKYSIDSQRFIMENLAIIYELNQLLSPN